MTRQEAVAYCEAHLSRVPSNHEEHWDEYYGWGPSFDDALWFSNEVNGYYTIGDRDVRIGYDTIPEAVEQFKRQILLWRLADVVPG
jgi:hypothetical protein